MRKKTLRQLLSGILAALLLLTFTACGEGQKEPLADVQSTAKTDAIGYPRMEEIIWSFRNTVRYGEPVAAFDYANQSSYTITKLDVHFRMKDGVTSEELDLKDVLTGELIPDEEIPEMEPFVYDRIVCDPGETAEGAICYMTYNTEPTSAEQCALMDLESADIAYIGEDGKEHTVSYHAENNGYALSEKSSELFTWVDNTYTEMIPKPDSRVASAEQYDENCLYAKIYDFGYEDFQTYIQACEEMGFQNKYPKEEINSLYVGAKPEGYEITLQYIESMKCVEIELKKTEE